MTTTYELRFEGHLDRHWSGFLGGLSMSHEDDGTTILRRDVADQSELHGLLAAVRDLGVTLISLTPVHPASEGDSLEQQHS
ncbi:hypothetical protein [Pedococcus bigeumensis]|uniref:Uncharacterized protein n=1 Tax=Pedococcus bigeumensis TaxID=433644 RepID=A0A502CY01_9MICO|nr:hypothetical protein [Pedococcus bigeumensis]TPG18147.1 hypothetical protein EAH86_07040 [Pedococcus bigeumensis]